MLQKASARRQAQRHATASGPTEKISVLHCLPSAAPLLLVESGGAAGAATARGLPDVGLSLAAARNGGTAPGTGRLGAARKSARVSSPETTAFSPTPSWETLGSQAGRPSGIGAGDGQDQ